MLFRGFCEKFLYPFSFADHEEYVERFKFQFSRISRQGSKFKFIWLSLGIMKVTITILLVSLTLTSFSQKLKWHKGNTHAHTTMSDGNASPEFVVNWYHEQGYNFLVITDHNKFVNPDSIKMPNPLRKDFILIPGEEVTGARVIHTTGLNVHNHVHPGEEFNSKTEVIQSHVDSIRQAGGIPILNHPNFESGAQVSDIYPVDRLHMLELFNGHPYVFNYGREGKHISVEAKWDSLLSKGRKYFAISSDDAHHYDTYAKDRSNPGRGWIMVKSTSLTTDAIVSAINKGDFYATNGVILSKAKIKRRSIRITVDENETDKSLQSPFVIGQETDNGSAGYTIEFIGYGGMVMQKTKANSGKYKIAKDEPYIRCKVTCHKLNKDGMASAFYAWTQPLFAP